MQEPWPSIICLETDSNIVIGSSSRNNIAADWVRKIVGAAAGAPHDIKSVLYRTKSGIPKASRKTYPVQVERMLFKRYISAQL